MGKKMVMRLGLVVLVMGLISFTISAKGGCNWWIDDDPINNKDTTSGSSSLPAQVTSPNPADGATNVPITILLSWTATSDATSYDVYFGTSTIPPYQYNTTGTSYAPVTLAYETTYHWRIDSKNSVGTTAGPVWSFTTAPDPAETVSTPDQPHGPISGTTGIGYTYSTGGASSNLGHSIQYLFDWGDGSNSGWLPVGTTSASKSWASAGTYLVKAQARCATGTSVVSSWSSGLSVSIFCWTRQLGTSSTDWAYGVATDLSGNIYVAGFTAGGLDGNTNTGGYDLFVVKYNSAGVKQWTRQLGTSSTDHAYCVATDSAGNVYVAGDTTGGLDDNTSAGSSDLFVVKYNSAGEKQWTRQLGSSMLDWAYGVATDTSGNIYVAGTTMGGLDGNTHAGYEDLFVVKYNSAGEKQWTRQLGTSSDDFGWAIATDTDGNIYVAGHTLGKLDGNANAGSADLFVVKYNSAGEKLWTRQLGSSMLDWAYGVATDLSGNIYVAGKTNGGLDGHSGTGYGDFFVVKYNSGGVKQWTRQLVSSGLQLARSVTTDTDGNIYVAGETDSGLDGNTSAGDWDLFVVKYNSAGVKQWTRQLGTSSDDRAFSVATDTDGNIYVAGKTLGGLDGNTNAGGADLFVVKYNSAGVKQ